jgi:ElaB/YqjD/DUF883 family membrane-anchored ribosome-binding protein
MDTPLNTIADSGKDMADAAASKIQSGIRQAKRTVDKAGDQLSGRVEDLRTDSKPLIKHMKDQAQSFAEGARDTGREFRDAASRVSDSVISFTKNNPVKAILIAAASGAALMALSKAIAVARSRRN